MTISLNATDKQKLHDMATALRVLSMDAVEKAKSGHPGLPMGAADIATVLFGKFLKFDPTMPDWADRDRFILSAGHGSMLLYSLLHLIGVEEMTLEELKNFRQFGARTAGHPEYGHCPGIETTTGPLGQGLGNAVGMALAERILNAQFGDDIVDHYTYVLASDGDLMEGISHESISIAGHLKLSKLIVLFDDNGISIDGPVSLAESGDMRKRFEAAGWHTLAINGHDYDEIAAALDEAKHSDKPTMIACRTTIGYGAPNKEGKSSSHGSPLGQEDIEGARQAYGWEHGPFEIPPHIRDSWRLCGTRSVHTRKDWEKRLADLDVEQRCEFERRMRGDLPASLDQAIQDYKVKLVQDAPKMATRQSSESALEVINGVVAETIGGSADLTGSNNTRTKGMVAIQAGNGYQGRFVHWGVREHGMAAAMNGMALHGGVIPYSGTFLVFSDYCRPSIRLAALMQQRVIHVMTHDSIGLGEDGPTHQPVEHLASLRAMPNLNVFRPCDSVETLECWQLALQHRSTPSVLALTRQGLPTLTKQAEEVNQCAKGAYELAGADNGEAEVSLFASGSEVSLAMKARDMLAEEGIAARVVSVPCFELFDQQSEGYQQDVLGDAPVRIAIEAAVEMGWRRFIGDKGIFIGMAGFGGSAPYQQLYEHFGITAEAVVKAAKDRLNHLSET
jgi:transketolase